MNQCPEQTSALVIATFGCLLLSGGFFLVDYSGQPPTDISLVRTLNPNHAPLGSLIRLPGIGLSRAQAIIAYRRARLDERPGHAVFFFASDLEQIRGIGPETARGLAPWLDFGATCCHACRGGATQE